MKRPSLLFRFLKRILKLFIKKPKIIDFNQSLPKRVLFVGNHAATKGPLFLALYFPYSFAPWGTFEMTLSYKERFKYLYHVIYQKKLKMGKLVSFLLSFFFAIVSKFLYRNVNLIPTYKDGRLIKTFKESRNVLNQDHSILVFPENSEDGYQDEMDTYYRGFLAFHRYYLNMEKIDLPIVPFYFDRKSKTILIGKPLQYKTLKSLCESEASMLKLIVNYTNYLHQYLKEQLG